MQLPSTRLPNGNSVNDYSNMSATELVEALMEDARAFRDRANYAHAEVARLVKFTTVFAVAFIGACIVVALNYISTETSTPVDSFIRGVGAVLIVGFGAAVMVGIFAATDANLKGKLATANCAQLTTLALAVLAERSFVVGFDFDNVPRIERVPNEK